MNQPNLIETIEKALNQEIPVEWHKDGPAWLRTLLEERRTHAPHGRNYTNEQYVSLRLELEQVKAERDGLQEDLFYEKRATEEYRDSYEKQYNENESLRTELSAKSRFVEEFALGSPYATRNKSHSLLVKYPPRREEDET